MLMDDSIFKTFKQHQGNRLSRATVTEAERKELEKAGVFLHDEQKR